MLLILDGIVIFPSSTANGDITNEDFKDKNAVDFNNRFGSQLKGLAELEEPWMAPGGEYFDSEDNLPLLAFQISKRQKATNF